MGGVRRVPVSAIKDTSQLCPFCWTYLQGWKGFKWHQTTQCPNCNEYLVQPDSAPIQIEERKGERKSVVPSNGTGRRMAPGDYIVKRMPEWADIYIADEVHQYKAGDTAQGEVCGRIAQTAKRVLAMTGTFMGGKASELFYIFHRFGRDFSGDLDWNGMMQFIEKYGRRRFTWSATKNNQLDPRIGVDTRRRQGVNTKIDEIVGFHPHLLKYILPNAIFIRREDIRPEKNEEPGHCRRCDTSFLYGFNDVCWRCRMNPELIRVPIQLNNTKYHAIKEGNWDPLAENEETGEYGAFVYTGGIANP